MTNTIKWNKRPIEQFGKAIAYIEKDSITNAYKFKVDILNKIDSLLNHPEKYSPDRYKVNNDGSFRALRCKVTESLTGVKGMKFVLSE